jgi:hypothetical protein
MFNLSRRFTTSDRSNRAGHDGRSDAHDDARYGAWAEDPHSVTEDSDVPGRHIASAKNPRVTPRSLSSTISFSDFSMHVHDDAHDDTHGIDHHLSQLKPVATKPVAIPLHSSLNSSMNSAATRNSIDNAELGMITQGSGMAATKSLRIQTKSSGGMSGSTAQQLSSPVSKSLGIPSVASIFGTPKVGLSGHAAGNASATPRSSLDLYDGTMSSAPTPTRTSADEGASVPVTPRSPGGSKSPGGSRRRGDRIQGLDSFEWLELVRGSSL